MAMGCRLVDRHPRFYLELTARDHVLILPRTCICYDQCLRRHVHVYLSMCLTIDVGVVDDDRRTEDGGLGLQLLG